MKKVYPHKYFIADKYINDIKRKYKCDMEAIDMALDDFITEAIMHEDPRFITLLEDWIGYLERGLNE